jgi:hypothetical protein
MSFDLAWVSSSFNIGFIGSLISFEEENGDENDEFDEKLNALSIEVLAEWSSNSSLALVVPQVELRRLGSELISFIDGFL